MSKVKRIVALSLALVLLVAAMSVSAYAATPRTYRAYQVFNAATNAEGSMGDIEWGSGVNPSGFVSALKNAGLLSRTVSVDDVDEVAKAVAAYSDEQARHFAKLAYANRAGDGMAVTPGETTLSPSGYYVVADVTDLNGTDEVNNIAVLKIAKGEKVQVEFKADQPTLVKKVQDANDSTSEQSDWQDSADYDIGDNVPFCLDAQLATITDYDTYKLVFHDTLSAGLTYAGNAQFYVVKGNQQIRINAPGNISVAVNGQELAFTVNNVRDTVADNGDIIRVVFEATLNENAVVGVAGNPNVGYLEYSNNPNNSESTGKTPEDKVSVFTYGFVVNKVETRKDDVGNEYNVPLSGATFKLEKKVNNRWNDLSAKLTLSGKDYNGTTIPDSVFTWTGLDDGEYKLTETKAPSGFNGVDPIEFTVTAEHEIVSDDPRLTALLCNNEGIEVVTSNGQLTGELATTVVNEQGVVLPETGGTGNTVMYVMGSLLVLGAGVVLVSKRRMTGK